MICPKCGENTSFVVCTNCGVNVVWYKKYGNYIDPVNCNDNKFNNTRSDSFSIEDELNNLFKIKED